MGIAAVVAVAAIGGYLLTHRQAPSPNMVATTTEDGSATAQGGATTFSGSMRELAMRGGSYKCSVSSALNDGAGLENAVTYVSGGKVRTDATSDAGGTSIQSHMITDGEWMYMWSSNMAQGMKMKVPDAAATSSAVATAPAGQSVSYDAPYSYTCEPWVADAALLTPPSEVAFMEFSASGMPSMQGMPAGMPQ